VTAIAKKPRKWTVSKRDALHLPASAAFTQSGGQEFLLLPIADFEAWMEDRIDIALAKQALSENKPRIPMEEAHRRLGIK
jgi:hypothetical protein